MFTITAISTNSIVTDITSLVSAYVPTIVGLFIIGLGVTMLYRLLSRSKHLVK